jgi:hypothetical protein
MTVLAHAGRPAALLLFAFAFVVAACGGATTSGAPSGSSGAGTSAAPQAATPTPAATNGGQPSTAPSIAAFPSFDIGQLAAGLENVDSYRVSITVDGTEQYSGVVVTKPVLAREVTIAGGTKILVIGQEAWLAEDGGAYKQAPSQLVSAMVAGFDPTLMVAAFSGPQWAQSSLDIGDEQKNGVSATHYKIDSTTLVGGFAGVPPGAEINLWIADEGYLVAWESTGFAGTGSFSIQVTNVDDPANKVERPS